jgi:hypothetical protein
LSKKDQPSEIAATNSLSALPEPTPWPNANARLLGLGMGLPTEPLDRLANMSAKDFERVTLEWANGYLKEKLPSVHEVQIRGGAGDKGRDVVVWLDPPSVKPRRWHLYQCKHYSSKLGGPKAIVEVGKLIYYTHIGELTVPEIYSFVTHKGVTGDLQDLLDDPEKMKAWVLKSWDQSCSATITSKATISLDDKLKNHIESFDFSIFSAKQPLDFIKEHATTHYHLAVFGAPLIERPPAPEPPSEVTAQERIYTEQLYLVIAERLQIPVTSVKDFLSDADMSLLFKRSRVSFFSAEGLKGLARDRMSDAAFFDSLLKEFEDGLFHTYSIKGPSGLQRLQTTLQAAQQLQLGAHVLAPHTNALDREGVCHHLVNNETIKWCDK